MIEITGRYNSAKCYCDEIEETARQQIREMCDQQIFMGSKIRIMPDVHAGKGCTIGTTMTISDKAVPNLVGVDIGCGMETVRLVEKEIDFAELDQVIRTGIPAGENINETPHPMTAQIDLKELRCAKMINIERGILSLGTLGGGNHFIEIDRDEAGTLYLVIHSGSRSLGSQTASYYQELGWKTLKKVPEEIRKELISQYKAENRSSEIEQGLRKQAEDFSRSMSVPKEFAYVEKQDLEDYIHDMRIVQQFAALNRRAMAETILKRMGLTEADHFTTIHNYIDTENRILRKGAVSAQKGERLLIPINMRDGALICIGKGNPEWNCSAPHGAGRIMSRSAAKNSLTVERFREEMKGIFTTCVGAETLDESPMAYKGLEAILSHIDDTAEVEQRIKPAYNFKAGN